MCHIDTLSDLSEIDREEEDNEIAPGLIVVPHAYPTQTPSDELSHADRRMRELYEQTIIADPIPGEKFGPVPGVAKKPPDKVGTEWWWSARWSQIVISRLEWERHYQNGHPKQVEFLHLNEKSPIFQRGFYFTSKVNGERMSRDRVVYDWLHYIFAKHPDGSFIHQNEIDLIRTEVIGKVIVHRDGCRLNWAHAMVCVAKGARNFDEVERELAKRFCWENQERTRVLGANYQKDDTRAEYDKCFQRTIEQVELAVHNVRERLAIPAKFKSLHEQVQKEVLDTYGDFRQLRKNNYNVIRKYECSNEKDFTALALKIKHPLQHAPESTEDEIEAAFQAALDGPDLKKYLKRREKVAREINIIVKANYNELVKHRPWTAQRIGPNNNPIYMDVIAFLLDLPNRYENFQYLGFDVFWGMAIVDVIPDSGLFPKVSPESAAMGYAEIDQNNRRWVKNQVNRIRQQDDLDLELERVMLDKTQAEFDKGESMGPLTEGEVNSIWEPDSWRCLIRFLAWSAGKWRECDSGKASRHNVSTKMGEKLKCCDNSAVDKYSALVKFIWDILPTDIRAKKFRLVASTEDLQRAYRQVPVAQEHLKYNISIVPYMGQVRFVAIFALVFGLSSAVLQFNKIACFLTLYLRLGMGLLVVNYFDDYLAVQMANVAAFAKRMLYAIVIICGWYIDPAKGCTPSSVVKWLGVWKRISNKRVLSFLGKKRKKELSKLINSYLAPGATLTSGDASKLLGHFLFAGTALYGRVGMISLQAIRIRTGKNNFDTEITTPIREGLQYMLYLINTIGSATTLLNGQGRPVLVIFSDASCEDSRAVPQGLERSEVKDTICEEQRVRRAVQLGWSVYENGTLTDKGYSIVKQHVIDRWHKKQPIGIGEALAASMAVKRGLNGRKGFDILLFVDNIGAERSLRRGSSAEGVSSIIAHELHLYLAKTKSRIWTSYVPSACNESDEPSRCGELFGEPVPHFDVQEVLDLDQLEREMNSRSIISLVVFKLLQIRFKVLFLIVTISNSYFQNFNVKCQCSCIISILFLIL